MQTSVQKVVKEVGKSLTKNSPAILTGLACAGVVTTTVLAVRATPKAITILEEARVGTSETADTLSKRAVIKLTWKLYAPAALMGGLTICCMVGAHAIGSRRTAAIASLYTVSETALKEYQSKVVEIVGEKKEQSVRDGVAKDRVFSNPVVEETVIHTGKGSTLCMDILSGRYFRSDIESIRKVENDLNRTLLRDDYVSLNDLYHELGLPGTQLGELMGWNAEDIVTIRYSSQLTTEGTPCLVFECEPRPRFEFDA